MSVPPVRVDPDVPLPRRTALTPVLVDGDDVDVDPPPRVVAPPPDDVDEPVLPDPEELEPVEPLEGGAVRTGCCSEYDGAE